ncbi:MAG: hypothetical protein ACD_49C00038G0035 [uncultured bacterium (gcode 4)]|uniref:Uncharacterized protein n=1 Tax=uncultured bacterium (gcode 4) TaxID=1234023 RepID=K2AXK2_9BACT|nr:MAG: hypothetical protein ACD_49C00038G0035 [uncultured bacterium (gcode 4)]
MNLIKKVWLSTIALVALAQDTYAAMDLWKNNISGGMKWTEESAPNAVQTLLTNALKFIWVVAVVYAIYGWFLILTAGWKDDNVKKWKTILIQAAIWIIVIFLANSLVQFIFGLTGGTWN